MYDTWRRMNEHLTRTLVGKIDALPVPVKVAIGVLPVIGVATTYADMHRWTVVRLAEHYSKDGKLSKESRMALEAYKRGLATEQRAYERLLRALGKDTGIR